MTSPAVPIVFGGLIAWSFYRRVRRNIGRQKLRPRRFIVSLLIFGLVSLFMIYASLRNLNLLLGFGGGIFLGALLGLAGLRLTRFETTDEGHFYTPDTRIGIAISMLLVGRLLYRFWVLRDVSSAPDHPPPMQSALTFSIVGLTFGYYIVYYLGLLMHTRDKKPS
ncbi:MAG TPA: DUF1453 domain-containing protein [Verrucomicrobiae bacterium]|nr:DUF1453 domain-containing protein [Verrucomicrobiae bacterium]